MKPGASKQLFLRLYADCASADAADEIARRLMSALGAFSPAAAAPPERYWKMPERFGFAFDLAPATEASFEAVVAQASMGWTRMSPDDEEPVAIWNRGAGSVFLAAEVAWADLQLFGA